MALNVKLLKHLAPIPTVTDYRRNPWFSPCSVTGVQLGVALLDRLI